MSVHPVPSDFEARCNAAFEAVMWAMARPGLVRDLPTTGMAQLVEALIDRECAVYCAEPGLAELAEKTGALAVAPDRADHVFVDDIPDRLLTQLNCGTDLHPDDGATLIAKADFSNGPQLRLTGPGIDGHVVVSVGGLAHDFWQHRRRALRYPMGFEILLVDGARVLGIPRSTIVEVL